MLTPHWEYLSHRSMVLIIHVVSSVLNGMVEKIEKMTKHLLSTITKGLKEVRDQFVVFMENIVS